MCKYPNLDGKHFCLLGKHEPAIKEPQIGQMQKDADDKKINTNQQNLAVTDDDDGAFAFVFVFVFKYV